jgi:3,5-dihydroxyphenylacetyl-CoA synthase
LGSRPRILAVGTANPPHRYAQKELAKRYRVSDPRITALFEAGHIQHRYLYLPEADENGAPVESQGELLHKHLRGALEIGPMAIERALSGTDVGPADVDFLCCITTTGFLSPGLSAHLIHRLGFRPSCERVDVVGMGCNAGLNGLNPVSCWARANPGRNALMVCVEVCSAAYVFDNTMRTGIVNALFGDGAAVALVRADDADGARFAPEILGFSSHMITEALLGMRYDWDDESGKFSFFLDRDIPYILGLHVCTPVRALLSRFGLRRRDVRHWIVHSGGKKVIDAVKYNLGLTAHDVRHTVSVLRDYGNISSGSFLFSFQRLMDEGRVRRGDFGVMMTMGPGSQIETALIRW